MWNPFKEKPLLSDEDKSFQIETFKWLLTHFGGNAFSQHAQLIFPTEEFFPVEAKKEPAKVARHIFKLTKEYSGLEDWPCILEVQDTDAELRIAPTVVLQNIAPNPLSTFSTNEHNQAVITYNPDLASSPTQMIAIFSYELSLYLTSTAPEPPPGGWDNWGFATDITAAFLGFGVFQANSAFSFRQYTEIDSQGWQSSRNGFLSEAEYSFALALFIKLKDIPLTRVLPHCDTNIKAYLKKAVKEIESSDIIEELLQVKYLGSENHHDPSLRVAPSTSILELPSELERKLSLPLLKDLCALEMLDDDDTPMDYVVNVLIGCFNQTLSTAKETMLKVHHDGSAHLLTGNETIIKELVRFIKNDAKKHNYPLNFKITQKE